jgi:hypothetical protein
MSEYLEDFVARIDTPVLSQLYTTFVGDLVLDIPHLRQFIGRSRQLKPSKAARVSFDSQSILLEFPPGGLTLKIMYHRGDWKIASIASVCGQLSPFLSLVERLDLVVTYSPFELQEINSTESTVFLELLLPFTAIQSLYVSKSLVPFISTCTAEAHRGKGHRSINQPARSFLGGICNTWICP